MFSRLANSAKQIKSRQLAPKNLPLRAKPTNLNFGLADAGRRVFNRPGSVREPTYVTRNHNTICGFGCCPRRNGQFQEAEL
jgi:hypothetical protein